MLILPMDIFFSDPLLYQDSFAFCNYRGFDYYGVTFNYFLPANDANPEMLHINIIELEAKYGLYANGLNYADETLLFKVKLLCDLGEKVLAVPRCC